MWRFGKGVWRMRCLSVWHTSFRFCQVVQSTAIRNCFGELTICRVSVIFVVMKLCDFYSEIFKIFQKYSTIFLRYSTRNILPSKSNIVFLLLFKYTHAYPKRSLIQCTVTQHRIGQASNLIRQFDIQLKWKRVVVPLNNIDDCFRSKSVLYKKKNRTHITEKTKDVQRCLVGRSADACEPAAQ